MENDSKETALDADRMDAATLILKIQEFLEKVCYDQLLEKIRKAEKSLIVEFASLALFDPGLADYLLDYPDDFLKGVEIAVEQLNTGTKVKGFVLRFRQLPESSAILIRNIRSNHINKLLMFDGVVRNKSEVRPQMTAAKFECPSCGNNHIILQVDNKFQEPTRCSCGRKGKFRLVSKELVDAQMMVLEEVPEQLEGGEQPKRMNVLLKNDLVSPLTEKRTNPGARVSVVGIVKEVPIFLRTGGQSTKFDLFIESNQLEPVEEDFSDLKMDTEEVKAIKELAKDPLMMKKIVNSMAPSIYGHEKTKEALALQLAGGVRKKRDDGIITRGDIHILLVGDPGAAKSQLLKRMQHVAPKARYVTGKGASLDYEEPLLVRRNGVIQTLPIGKFVDERYIPGAENLMVPLMEHVETLALNQETLALEWKPIRYVYRHRTKEQLLKCTLETGRQVAVTGDHSIFILNEGKPCVVPANGLKEGNCVLIARKIPNEDSFRLSVEAARLLGYYIAEGHTHVSKRSSYKIEFTVHKNEKEIIEDINRCAQVVLGSPAKVYAHGANGARSIIYGKRAYQLFAFLLGDVLGKKAKEKRIPLCVVNAQKEARQAFLKAYIAGDAGVTKSRALMSDLLYLFLQDGIIASTHERADDKETTIHGRKVKSTGNRYDLKSPRNEKEYEARYCAPPFEALSQKTVRAFFREARSSGYARALPERAQNTLLLERLQKVIGKSSSGKEFRAAFGECSLEYVSDHRDLFLRQKCGREISIGMATDGKAAVEGLEQVKKLAESDLGFARIKKIEKVKSNNEFVYDVSVPGFESFVGGFGGIICHNSGAGLSAAVVKDEFLQGWSLEAGALVLANRGLCCIDEMDKMSKEDGWAMHEALEQQSVTISKANIQASLRCETTVLAAANPKFGRFDPYDTVANQINLAPTLINRFDLIFPIKDIPDSARDEKMASFILRMHKEDAQKPEVATKLLRKYFAYARQTCIPKLTDAAIDELREYYLKMRSSASGDGLKAVPISARQLEGLVRLSEASARLRLSDKVLKKDARKAIELLDYCLRQIAFDEKSGTFDIDRLATDTPAASRNKLILMKEVIADLELKVGKAIPVEDVMKAAAERDIDEAEAEEILQKLKRAGDVFEPKRGFISKI